MADWKQYVRAQLPALHARPLREAEIVEELAAQLEQAYQEALRAGQGPGEAERTAKAQMPDWHGLAAEIDASQPPKHRPEPRFWQGIPSDIRHAGRVLRSNPLFTGVAIATLALGIGGCTAMFSLIEAVLLRPIGYREPAKLVMVWEYHYRSGDHKNVVAPADYFDWKARNHVLSEMSPVVDQIWNVTSPGDPVVLNGISVSDRFLPMLGVGPLLGRSFLPEEAHAGGRQVAILSHRLWAERFGSSRDAIGKAIVLDGVARTIVGILPADFPWLGKPLDVLTPTQFADIDWRERAGRFMRVVARVKPAVSLARAREELSAIARQLEIEHPDFNKGWGVEIEPLADHFASDAGVALWVLMGAVGLLLLIACSNVANLLLARAVTREREMALRAALGATGRRLVRLLLIESASLALTGGAIGCAAAWAALRLVQAYGPQDIARLDSAGVNAPVALFALAASLLTGIAFGLAPASAARRLDLAATLKEGGRGVWSTVRGTRLRSAFVVTQVALALVLLTGAGLLLESLHRLSTVPTGFDPNHVLTATIMVSGDIDSRQDAYVATGTRLGAMCREITDRMRALPGVESAGFVTWLPFAGMGAATSFKVVGRPPYGPGQAPTAEVRVVRPGYFGTMRIPLLRGRLFTEAEDRKDAPRTFVVNQTLIRQLFRSADPLGQSLVVDMGDSIPGRIVGVVADTRYETLDSEIRPMVYYIQAQLPVSYGTFVMRTRGNPERLASAMVGAIQQVKKDQPVSDVRSMDDWIGRTLARARFQTALLAVFALIALALAAIGVYGVMAYAVEQRSHEIGVRLALGAEPGALQRWIAGQGLRLAAAGLTLGLAGSALATRLLRSLLYGITPNDPATYLTAVAVLAAACLAASYLPARRATAVDPVAALRGE